MGEKKVTVMVIKVDLECEKCRKKIKKVLCSIPQVQNQIYDEKTNTVTITVICCSPEKIKKKICCKGGDSIKGIEIKEPPPAKPKPPPPKAPEPAPPPPKAPEPAPPPPKAPEPAPPPPKAPEPAPPPPKAPEPAPPPPKAPEPAPPPPKAPAAPPPKAPEPAPPKKPEPVPCYPPPRRTCCPECYGGHGGGPCWVGYGRPPPCYEDYGRPVYESWSGGYGYGYGGCRRGYCVGRCDCLSDENPSACSVM